MLVAFECREDRAEQISRDQFAPFARSFFAKPDERFTVHGMLVNPAMQERAQLVLQACFRKNTRNLQHGSRVMTLH